MKKEIPKCPKCGSEVKLVDAKLGELKGISITVTSSPRLKSRGSCF
ncbi:MAG: hypothetical protein ACPLRT_08170 [Thermoproteota archaeon]